MRIAFINPPVWHYTKVGPLSFNPNLGIMMLAAVLEEKGHQVRCFDAEALRWTHDMVLTVLRDYQPETVGITGTTLGWPSMKELVRKVKDATAGKCRVVIGGSHVSHDPRKCMEESGADCAVGKEAETVIEAVVTGECDGQAFTVDGYEDFANLPWPARHLNTPPINTIYMGNFPRYILPETCVNWERGCPHHCSFCSHTVYGNRPMRFRDPGDIVEELKSLKTDWGIKSVFVYDDELIGVSQKQNEWLEQVLDCLIAADLGLQFKTQARCNKKVVTRDLLDKMKRAGFVCLFLGCESGSEKVLKAANKHTTPDDIRHTVRTVHEAGIETFTLWMVGNLEETPADIEMTADLVRELKPWITNKQVTICTPWVGSKVHRLAMNGGWMLASDPVQWLADRPAMRTPWMTPQQMVDARLKLYSI